GQGRARCCPGEYRRRGAGVAVQRRRRAVRGGRMSGTQFRIELDDAAAQRMFASLHAGVTSGALPLFTEIGSALEASTRERIESTKRAPDGTPWLPLSEAWVEHKRGKGYAEGILTMRGDLLNSVAFEAAQ